MCSKNFYVLMTGVTPESTECTKCVIAKKAGKSTCCARGGSWFGKCGDPDDPDVEHTWYEGVDACKNLKLSLEDQALGHSNAVVSQQSRGPRMGNASADKCVITVILPTIMAISCLFA